MQEGCLKCPGESLPCRRGGPASLHSLKACSALVQGTCKRLASLFLEASLAVALQGKARQARFCAAGGKALWHGRCTGLGALGYAGVTSELALNPAKEHTATLPALINTTGNSRTCPCHITADCFAAACCCHCMHGCTLLHPADSRSHWPQQAGSQGGGSAEVDHPPAQRGNRKLKPRGVCGSWLPPAVHKAQLQA